MDEQTPKARAFTRRRRANATGGRLHFHKVGVTPEEGGELARIAAAQHVTVPRLMVEAALSSERAETPTERRQAMAEMFTVHRLLAAISNNVNQMAHHSNVVRHVVDEGGALAKLKELEALIEGFVDDKLKSP